MNRFVKLFLASALLACTVTASACSGGAERGESQKTPSSPETAGAGQDGRGKRDAGRKHRASCRFGSPFRRGKMD